MSVKKGMGGEAYPMAPALNTRTCFDLAEIPKSRRVRGYEGPGKKRERFIKRMPQGVLGKDLEGRGGKNVREKDTLLIESIQLTSRLPY